MGRLAIRIGAAAIQTNAMVERAVLELDDLAIGGMREVQVGTRPVLLVRLEDGVRALGAPPHFGALWRKSVLSDGGIVCPWHHACYSAATDDLLEPPAQDGLARYPVRVEDGRVLVSVPDDAGSPHPRSRRA